MGRQQKNAVDTQAVHALIDSSAAHEQRTAFVRNALKNAAAMVGRQLSRQDLDQSLQFILEYLRQVPVQLEAIVAAAQDTQFASEVDKLVQTSLAYWNEPNDFLPDHLGLLGIMDDGYVTMSLLQAISERCERAVGRPLLPDSFAPANQIMRNLIGSPVVEQLDAWVATHIGSGPTPDLLAQLMRFAASARFSNYTPPDPIWGNATPEEIAKARLGAMGIF